MLAREAEPTARAFSDFRLPPGRHGMTPEQVAENQRWRLLGAAAEVLAEDGHVSTTSTRVSKRAGVSPATFYRHFDNIGDCLSAAYDAASDCVLGIVSEACEEEQIEWRRRLGVAVASILRFLAVDPATAHLLGPEAAAGEAAVARARRELIERLAGKLGAGRALRKAGAAEPPEGIERLLVAGAFAICSERIAAGEADRLPELAPALTEMLSAHYVR